MGADLRTCHVVDDGCKRPAGWRVGSGAANATASDMEGRCYVCHTCGLDVCGACSTVAVRRVRNKWRQYVRRRVRVCNGCIVDADRSSVTPHPSPARP